ncbi:hypothetical protein FB480_101838 [Agrobacterium vitis]|nr:hypothetical protein FB480_101838 [Agrobacterium vitis]
MTIKLASLAVDLELEKNGEWIEFPEWPGVSFCVCSLMNPDYQVARELLLQRLQKQYGTKPIPQDVMVAEVGALFSQHILRGWRGFDLPYDQKKAAQMLTDPQFRKLVAAVQWCAGEVGQTEIEFVETEVKNSEPPSGPGSGISARAKKK